MGKGFWGKLLAVLPFPIIFSLMTQGAYWLGHREIPMVAAVASILGALSAVLLVNSFTLSLSLKAKTVRSATQLSLFFVVPILLLVQLGHEIFLQSLLLPLMIFALSVVAGLMMTFLGRRKFVSL